MTLTPIALKLIFLCTPWLIILLALCVYGWVAASKHFESMVIALPSSYWLGISYLMHNDITFWGRLNITIMMSGVVFWPIKNLHIRKKKLDPADIKNFPKNLKRIFLLGNTLLYSGIASLPLIYFI
ncbi:hypothetical protein [Pseudomonas sp. NPDC089406]|uniref:hypothetical protein n=1 Tax=Pseudomonas sp. NPDC089406 TaxID=3364463 RepID=UPI0038510F68